MADPYAIKILEESRNVPMPVLPGMTRERCENLLDLIDAESKLEESQFKGLQISNKPFTDADRKLGREIFLGKQRLRAGGAACISCHSMHDIADAGWRRWPRSSRLRLTNVYRAVDGSQSVERLVGGTGHGNDAANLQKSSDDSDEIHALVAYFDASAGETPAEPAASRIAFLLVGLLGAAAVVFGFDAIWKRRFHSVRQPLVDANSLQASQINESALMSIVKRRDRLDSRRSQSRRPAVGGVLSQPLAARQGRAQHARRELHRRLHVEDPRQRRHRHLGNAGARLPAARSRHPALRAARLPARHFVSAGISTARCA